MTRKLVLLALLVPLASTAFGQSPYENRNRGLTMGALMGALGGAAIGEHNDNPLAGAAIGTAVGALAGAAIGDSVDNDIARQEAYQQRVYTQQISQAATVDGVISMSRARLSDSVIVTHIHTHGVAYRPQSHDLIALSQNGVSDVVIQAMQTARLATAPAPVVVQPRPVIVQERYYVRPPYPHYYPPRPHYPPHHYYPRHSGVHWGVTIGR